MSTALDDRSEDDLSRRLASIEPSSPALFAVADGARTLTDPATVAVIEATIRRSVTDAIPRAARPEEFTVAVQSEDPRLSPSGISTLRSVACVELVDGRRIELTFESEMKSGQLRPRVRHVGPARVVALDGSAIQELTYEVPWQLAVRGVAKVEECRVLGGHGLGLSVGSLYTLSFGQKGFVLEDGASTAGATSYRELLTFEIGGPGETQSGGGYVGGGFGAQGAAEGVLVAAALNLLTTRRRIDTVLCLQTTSGEVFLHYGGEGPRELRMRLSAVFGHIQSAQRVPAAPVQAAPNATERTPIAELTQLAALLDRGLVTADEFARLKRAVIDALPDSL